MTYLEEYFTKYHIDMRDFLILQEDYDGVCPRDMGMNDCTGMKCIDCWNREIEEDNE